MPRGWRLSLGRGAYEGVRDAKIAFGIFVDRIDEIEEEAIGTNEDVTRET